ncbi:MAG TPA: hypothetical protein VMV43_11775 [Candidatus Nanopelagicaceae bacterium]|nr:hypothetical protein [Candidatus Nanopelagicaceae bacterium]
MELFFVFFFSNPIFLINQLLRAITIIPYNILLLLAVKKNKQEFRKSKMMMISCLVALILSVAYFFIPGIVAINVSQEESIILTIIFSLYNAGYMVPYIITQGVLLLIFGIKNKEKYNSFIFIAGMLLTIDYTYLIISNFFFLNYELYSTFRLLFSVLGYINFAVRISAYVFLLIQGIRYHQNLFTALGITMVSLHIALFFLSPIIVSLTIQFL